MSLLPHKKAFYTFATIFVGGIVASTLTTSLLYAESEAGRPITEPSSFVPATTESLSQSESGSTTPTQNAVNEEAPGDEESTDFGDFGDLDLAALLDTKVESASSRKETISDAPAVIDVITPEQMRAWGVSTLNEALEMVAGIEVVENYYGYTNINMRGIGQPLYNAKLLILLDGVPLYEVANMSAHLEQVPINSVARIEVIRGPGAVLYGTNAYAGVVQIFTKQPDKNEAHAYLGAGGRAASDAEQTGINALGGDFRADGSYLWNLKDKDGSVRFSIQTLSTPRWTATVKSDEYGVSDTFPRMETAVASVLRVQQDLGKGHILTLLSNFAWQQKSKWGVLPQSVLDSEVNVLTTSVHDLSWKYTRGHWQTGARIQFHEYIREGRLGRFPAGDPLDRAMQGDPFAGYSGWDKRHTLYVDSYSVRGEATLGYYADRYSLTGGLSHMLDAFKEYQLRFAVDRALSPLSPPLDTSAKMNDSNIFVQGSYSPWTWISLTAGLRYNRFSADQLDTSKPLPSIKHRQNPRAAAVFRVNKRHTVKILYGQAFRLPSMFELYANATKIILGDANLKPEGINTYEVAWDARPLDSLSLRINAFQNATTNVIERFVDDTDGITKYRNGRGIFSYGTEMTLRWVPWQWLDIFGTAGFQEAWGTSVDSTATNGILGTEYTQYQSQIARVTAQGGVTFTLLDKRFDITPRTQYIGKRAGLGGVVLWHVTSHYAITDALEVGILVRNLLNRRYASPELLRDTVPQGMVLNEPLRIYLTVDWQIL